MFFVGKPMRRVITYIVAIVATTLWGSQTLSAQELRLGADFTTLFDNKEYAGMEGDISGTLFSARLTPHVGIEWREHNELMFGVDLVQNFGHKSKFLSDVNVQLYYGYTGDRLKLYAGIFPRTKMQGLDSPLYFDRSYRYYNNRIGGVLARYEWPKRGYIELAMDYTGMRDFDTREAFMIMSSARHTLGQSAHKVSYGYDFYMGHYAKDNNPETIDGVVDNILLTPYVNYNGAFDLGGGRHSLTLDAKLSYVQSLQRDRIHEGTWEAPLGGEVYVALGWQGLELSNRLYVGTGSLLTYYNRYGAELYHGCPMYRTSKGIYDAISLSYEQCFFDDTVGVELGITAEYDGTAWGTRQWLQVNVALDYGISLKRKQHID